MEIIEYIPSINLAIAEQYLELNNVSKASGYARASETVAASLKAVEVKEQINEILVNLSNHLKND